MKRKANKAFITLKVSAREYDTMLAALRFWQAEVTDNMTETEGIPIDFADIALEHGDALTSNQIDAFIERMQFYSPSPKSKVIATGDLRDYL